MLRRRSRKVALCFVRSFRALWRSVSLASVVRMSNSSPLTSSGIERSRSCKERTVIGFCNKIWEKGKTPTDSRAISNNKARAEPLAITSSLSSEPRCFFSCFRFLKWIFFFFSFFLFCSWSERKHTFEPRLGFVWGGGWSPRGSNCQQPQQPTCQNSFEKRSPRGSPSPLLWFRPRWPEWSIQFRGSPGTRTDMLYVMIIRGKKGRDSRQAWASRPGNFGWSLGGLGEPHWKFPRC